MSECSLTETHPHLSHIQIEPPLHSCWMCCIVLWFSLWLELLQLQTISPSCNVISHTQVFHIHPLMDHSLYFGARINSADEKDKLLPSGLDELVELSIIIILSVCQFIFFWIKGLHICFSTTLNLNPFFLNVVLVWACGEIQKISIVMWLLLSRNSRKVDCLVCHLKCLPCRAIPTAQVLLKFWHLLYHAWFSTFLSALINIYFCNTKLNRYWYFCKKVGWGMEARMAHFFLPSFTTSHTLQWSLFIQPLRFQPPSFLKTGLGCWRSSLNSLCTVLATLRKKFCFRIF